MKLPSEEDIAAAKRSAVAKGTFCELITFDDLDAAVIVDAMNAREWAAYCDALEGNVTDAREGAYTTQVVWPSPAEADALRERIPAFADRIIGYLHEFSGRSAADPSTCKLNAATPPSKLARAGLTTDRAAELLTRYQHPQRLTIATWPGLDISAEGKGFSIVVKIPSKPVYSARLDVYQKAKNAESGVWDAATQAARDFIVWTSEGDNPDPIFAAWPGVVAGDMIALFQLVGGAAAKGERRRL